MRAVVLALVVWVTAWPGLAQACPQCAANDKGGLTVGFLIASMIALPFVVTTVVYRVIRKDLRE